VVDAFVIEAGITGIADRVDAHCVIKDPPAQGEQIRIAAAQIQCEDRRPRIIVIGIARSVGARTIFVQDPSVVRLAIVELAREIREPAEIKKSPSWHV
jgi:hypothetical protein